MSTKKSNTGIKSKFRFLNLTDAAPVLGTSVSSISRKLGDDIKGGEMQVYVKVDDAYFPVGETKMKVVDVSETD